MTLKIIDDFITTVDPNKTTVVSFPEFIAIFGGAISSKKPPKRLKSFRDAYFWYINKPPPNKLKDLLLLPENYNDWSDFSTYSDLLLFEKDLGYITGAVIIFLESFGSIAELGAFSQIDSLSERLIVVVTNNHHPKKSFISLGPIRSVQITKEHTNSVCVIPDIKPNQLQAHFPVIDEMLRKKMKRDNKTETFKAENHQHQILLILDLINLFSVVIKTELMHLASHFGVDLNLNRINQILFLLEKVELISREHYGGTEYYVPRNFKNKYIDYTSKSTTSSFVREKIKALAWKEIKNDVYRKNVNIQGAQK